MAFLHGHLSTFVEDSLVERGFRNDNVSEENKSYLFDVHHSHQESQITVLCLVLVIYAIAAVCVTAVLRACLSRL